jgi:hypothetical protein
MAWSIRASIVVTTVLACGPLLDGRLLGSTQGARTPPSTGSLRSPDGRVTVTLGAKTPTPDSSGVQFASLSDDAPEAVHGTHYRVTAASRSVSWSADSRLSIAWALADAPGGARPADLALMRRTAAAWVPLEAPEIDATHATGAFHGEGEYELRWKPSRTCTGGAAHVMDFRLGTWDVKATGYDPGRATVAADPSGCAIFEHYVDVKGGRSDGCFLLGADGLWYETVIDPSGRAILKGTAISDGLAFYHSPTEREVYRRGPNGTVAFAAERSSDGGQTWSPWATSTYTRVVAKH